jgi:pyridoxal phosphate enzyme (YggS family)
MLDIEANLKAVRWHIEAAAHRAGRNPEEITLLAVSKRIDVARIEAALASGARALGESRVQEADAKIPEIKGDSEWHFIGPLQSNKAMLAARLFDSIHSVRKASLVSRLSASATAANRSVQIYVQIERSAEPLAGTKVSEVTDICHQVHKANGLKLQGLMTMAPYAPDPEASRPYFATLRLLRDEIAASDSKFAPLGLSMGMSSDFQVAIEEGATIVRVGTAIFGKRSP